MVDAGGTGDIAVDVAEGGEAALIGEEVGDLAGSEFGFDGLGEDVGEALEEVGVKARDIGLPPKKATGPVPRERWGTIGRSFKGPSGYAQA